MISGPDWDMLAAALTAATSKQQRRSILAERAPGLLAELQRVREAPWALDAWGVSHNHDENAGQRTVAAGALAAVADATGHKLPVQACHSGLLHTYGYLLSTIETPYGKKRDRWLQPSIENGFGLKRLLRPMPREGSLLDNVTWWLARIAFRDDPAWQRRLQRSPAAATIRSYSYESLAATRITQRVRLENRRMVDLCTELVPFPHPRQRAPHGVLIYWQRTSATGPRLLTMFPVSRQTMQTCLAAAAPESQDSLLPRYNACIEGFKEPRRGRTTVTETESLAGRQSQTARRS
ncbi:MAG: hypothetical protein AB8H80_16580 [Planctomycetota bacterium]